MKLSKHVLTMIVAGSALATVSTSCEKEDCDIKPQDRDNAECCFGEEESGEKCNEPVYCEACGMG